MLRTRVALREDGATGFDGKKWGKVTGKCIGSLPPRRASLGV
jgi:hypothetical protein